MAPPRIKTNASQMAKWSNSGVNDCQRWNSGQSNGLTSRTQCKVGADWRSIVDWPSVKVAAAPTMRRRTAGQKSRKPICTLWHWKPPLTFWATLAHLFPLAAQCVSTIQDSQSLGPSACWWLPTSWCLPSCYLTHPWKTRLPDSWEAHCSQWWWPQTHRLTQDSWKPIVMIPIYVIIRWKMDVIISFSVVWTQERSANSDWFESSADNQRQSKTRFQICFLLLEGIKRMLTQSSLLELFLKFNGKDHLSMDIGHIP